MVLGRSKKQSLSTYMTESIWEKVKGPSHNQLTPHNRNITIIRLWLSVRNSINTIHAVR